MRAADAVPDAVPDAALDAVRPRPDLLLLCPLQFERDTLGRLLRDRLGPDLQPRIHLETTGPGRAGVHAWFSRWRFDEPPATHGVLLVGTAGGLSVHASSGRAFLANRIVSGGGRAWTPPIGGGDLAPHGAATATVISWQFALASPEAKANLHRTSGADLVDLESTAFAEACADRRWRFGVVRGVSDGPTEHLPRGIGSWVAADGSLRWARMLAGLAGRPHDLLHLPRLRRDSFAALRAASELLAALWADRCGGSTGAVR